MTQTAWSIEGIPAGWQLRRLGDLCRVVGGSTPTSSVSEFWNGGIVWTTPSDLGKLKSMYITDSSRRITRAGLENCAAEMVPTGSVVLSSRAPIGHLGIAAVDLCTNQGCKTFVPSEDVHSVFLYFALMQAVPVLQTLGSGAIFAEVSKSQLERFELPFPPLSEQKRIALLLTEKMEAIQRARAAAEAQLKAAKDLPAAYMRVTFDTSEMRQWPRKQLEQVCNISTGTTPDTNRLDYYKGDIPFVKTSELLDNRISSSETYVSQQAVNDYRLKLYPPGTVLLAMYGQGKTRGRVGLLDIPATTTQNAAALIPDGSLDSEFLWLWLRSQYNFLRGIGYQGDLSHLSLGFVKQLEIPVPAMSIQRSIAAALLKELEASERLSHKTWEQFNALEYLPDTLLRQAFTGKL